MTFSIEIIDIGFDTYLSMYKNWLLGLYQNLLIILF